MTDTLGFVCLGQVKVFGHGVKLFHVSQYFLSSDLMTCTEGQKTQIRNKDLTFCD